MIVCNNFCVSARTHTDMDSMYEWCGDVSISFFPKRSLSSPLLTHSRFLRGMRSARAALVGWPWRRLRARGGFRSLAALPGDRGSYSYDDRVPLVRSHADASLKGS